MPEPLFIVGLYRKKTTHRLSNFVLADAQKQPKLNVINYKHEYNAPAHLNMPTTPSISQLRINQRNVVVVVHGLHPREDVDDCDLFLQLCEDHLECKPYINRTKCRRLGKKTPPEGRSKPLLVVLESESSAQELIRKSYSLRAGYDDEVKNIYINRDLTPAKALAAYEVRRKRRTDRSRFVNTAVNTAANNIQGGPKKSKPLSRIVIKL